MDNRFFLKDEYLKNKSGIYIITNTINNKFYIGSSKNIYLRKNKHLYLLRNNIHHNVHLQNSYNLYGEEKFIFDVIEYCNINKTFEIEQKYLDIYFKFGEIYNICKIAGQGPCHTTKIICIEKCKVFDSIRSASRELNLDASTITKVCKNKRKSTKGLHFMYYNDFITKDEDYIQELLLQCKNGVKIICHETQELFYSITQASQKYNIVNTAINNCLKKRSRTCCGYHWFYYDYYINNIEEVKKEVSKKYICNNHRVKCLNDGKIFDSKTEASKYYGIDISSVSNGCTNKYNSKYKFMLIDN